MNTFDAGVIAFGAALNVAVGYLVSVLKLPLYLDSIGTILIASLCGWWYGTLVGLAALVVLTLTTSPTMLAYAGTVLVIATGASILARFGFLRKLSVTVMGGILLGVLGALVSVPVTTWIYGGVSLAGADAVTTLFKVSGLPVWKSVLYGGLVTDPVDKLVTALIGYALVRSLPPRLVRKLSRDRAGISRPAAH